MKTARTIARDNGLRFVETADRLCHVCNEGYCAWCNGWDRTIIGGEVVVVRCAHECREQMRRKPSQSTVRSTISRRHQA